MSWLSVLYNNNKKIIDPVLEGGASLLGGPAAGAAVGAGLNYANNHNLGQAALAGVEGYGLGKVGSALGKIPGVSGITNAAGDAGRYLENNIPGLSQIADAGGDVGSYLKDKLGGVKLPSLGAITGGGSGGPGLDLMGLGGVANAAYLQDKANNFAQLAGESADRSYNERAPLRTAGLAGLQAAPRALPTLGQIRTTGNPFAR